MSFNRKKEFILNILSSNRSIFQKEAILDDWFKIQHYQIESTVSSEDKDCYGEAPLDPRAIYTSYLDFFNIAKKLDFNQGGSFVDLGAGVGRSKLLYSFIYPQLKVICIEKMQGRLKACEKSLSYFGLDTTGLICGDLNEIEIPVADYYFIYLPAGKMLNRVLGELKKIAKSKPFTLIAIESHGDLFDKLEKFAPWLTRKDSHLQTALERHNNNIHFYQPLESKEMDVYLKEEQDVFKKFMEVLKAEGRIQLTDIPKVYRHNFILSLSGRNDIELVIKDRSIGDNEDHLWLASTTDIETSLLKDHYHSRFPSRDFRVKQIYKIIMAPPELKLWRGLRFRDAEFMDFGLVRKILIYPHVQIEFSKKGRVDIGNLTSNIKTKSFFSDLY
ncbi:MAG: hypothetical protein HOE90_04660 [Bacteriovoracaceae bacterium]|jgi:hypothetical protein|nr:hypothetical protein [Bacteriovoracaceae bacterium]